MRAERAIEKSRVMHERYQMPYPQNKKKTTTHLFGFHRRFNTPSILFGHKLQPANCILKCPKILLTDIRTHWSAVFPLHNNVHRSCVIRAD